MEKDIGKLKKNDTTDVLLRIDDFGGRRGFTIREFVTSDRYTGFTKAGVRILAADFPKFKEMINSISDEDMKDEVTPNAPVEPKEQATLEEKSEGTMDY
jgi:hypothetical protein